LNSCALRRKLWFVCLVSGKCFRKTWFGFKRIDLKRRSSASRDRASASRAACGKTPEHLRMELSQECSERRDQQSGKTSSGPHNQPMLHIAHVYRHKANLRYLPNSWIPMRRPTSIEKQLLLPIRLVTKDCVQRSRCAILYSDRMALTLCW